MADFSLVLDMDGKVVEVAVSSEELTSAVNDSWVGSELAAMVTLDSRSRTTELLALAAASPGIPVQRDLTHLLPDGAELLVQYRAICPSPETGIIALGQDMRPSANLRQQLMNAQQALEQDYWRLRQIETRYRRLFEMVSDAIIVVEGESGRVIEANPEASRLLSPDGGSIVGKPFPLGLDANGENAVRGLMAEARAISKGSVQGVGSADGQRSFNVSASYLRQGAEARFLVRLSGVSAEADRPGGGPGSPYHMEETLRRAPDAVMVTDDDGRIVAANRAFLDLAQILSEDLVLGQPADRWLGRSAVDLSVLLTNLRRNSTIKLFSTTIQGELGASADVEVSACNAAESGSRVYAFFIRDVGRRVDDKHQAGGQLPRSIEQITKRVGRVPLKELVRESTDVIEALCIEAALGLTHDNRASAAELLGLSRQSLYAKLRRYGIGGIASEAD
jgi:transcriptional regulator PpsR